MNWPMVEMSLPLSNRHRVGKSLLRKLQMSLLGFSGLGVQGVRG